MTAYETLKLAIAIAIFAGILYWVLIAPKRARRARRQSLGTPGGYGQAWDPRIWSGPRNR